MHLKDLKKKSPAELLSLAEEMGVENASTMRTQDLTFAILKQVSKNDEVLMDEGVIEVMPDGFGFLRSPQSNYLAGSDDIYVSPSQVKKFGLRTGDTVEGEIRAPKDGEKYFALAKISKVNFTDPENVRFRINFDNLTPLHPTEKIKMENDLDNKNMTSRIIDLICPQGKGQRGMIVAPPGDAAKHRPRDYAEQPRNLSDCAVD